MSVTKPFSLLKWKFVDPLDPDLHINISGLGRKHFHAKAFVTFVVQMLLLPEAFTCDTHTHTHLENIWLLVCYS